MGVAEDYPYPVALPYRIARDQGGELARRVWAVPFTALQAVKLTTLPLVAQYLDDPAETEKLASRNPRAIDALNTAIAGIRSPHYSDWLTLLHIAGERLDQLKIEPVFPVNTLREFLGAEENKVSPFSEAYAPSGREKEKLTLLEAMQFLRNGLAHGGLPLRAECQQLLDHYLPILDTLLDAFAFLAEGEWLARAQDIPTASEQKVRVQRLRGATLPEPETVDLDEPLRHAFEQSDIVLRVNHRVLPLHPLFYHQPTEPCAQYDQPTEPCAQYDGHFARQAGATGAVLYLGVYHRFQEEKAFEALREKLERRRVQWWLSRGQTAPWTLYDSVRHYATQTLEDLRGQKYFPETYREREAVARHLRQFLAEGEADIGQRGQRRRRYRNGFLLLGEAGSGKTAWCAHVVEGLLREGVEEGAPWEQDLERRGRNLVFFIRGDALDLARRNLFHNLAGRMGVRVQAVGVDRPRAAKRDARDAGFATFDDLLKLLDQRWSEDQVRQDRRLVLVLDALNECEQSEQALRETLELIATAAAYPWCKVIATVRAEFLSVLRGRRESLVAPDPFEAVRRYLYIPERAEPSVGISTEQPPGVVLERLSEDEAAHIYSQYQAHRPAMPACDTPWEQLHETTRRLLTNPMLLHLFMHAHNGRPASRVVEESAVFGEYWLSLRRRFPQVENAARCVVGHMLREGRSLLTDDDAHSIRADWARDKTVQELQVLFSPLEALTVLGVVRKRVRIEGGGYVFVFQKILEQLVYQTLREQEGTGSPSREYWLERAAQPAPFPEAGSAFAFLFRELGEFRELDEAGQWQLAADLVEQGRAYVDMALEEFLKELAVETWEPGKAGASFERYVRGLAQYGKRWTARVLFKAAFDLHSTRYAPAATICYEQAAALCEALHRAHPEDLEIANGLARVLVILGVLLSDQDQTEEARRRYEQAAALYEALHRAHPEHVEIANGLATVLMNLGNLLSDQGQTEEARRRYERAVEIWEALYARVPTRRDVRYRLADTYYNLGALFYSMGRRGDAIKALTRYLDLEDRPGEQKWVERAREMLARLAHEQ